MRPLLPLLPKPSRYAGIEDNACRKNPEEVRLRVALAFPDTYDVGMSYLGQKILYNIVNSEPRWWAERVMAPEKEAAEILRAHNTPLATLESDTPLGNMHCLSFSITHELCYTNVLYMLDLAGIPLRTADRPKSLTQCPLVIAGGGALLSAEPLTPFVDIMVLGDGEESLPDVLRMLEKALDQGWTRDEMLLQSRTIPGVYVPSLFQQEFDAAGAPIFPLKPLRDDYQRPTRRIVADLNNAAYPTRQVVPVGAVHNRLSLEIARGCTRGCRFCHAGMVYRPVRERSADQIVSSVIQGLEKTGYDEVSLTSLSTTDHSCIRDVLGRLNRRLEDTGIRVSIPSQRLDSFGVDMAESVAGEKKGGLTFAPEAGSQRMRDIINKNVTEEDLDRAAKAAFEAGWNRMKLYFMMGLPGERDEDIVAIANLADHVLELGRSVVPKARRGSISVSISVSVFIPKAATPFQWCPQLDYDDVKRRQKLLITSVRNRAVRVHYHDAETSLIEAALSRAGRDMTPVIIDAWRAGSRFDAWVEHFSLDNWKEAAAKNGIDLNELVHLPYELDWRLPWEHVSPGCTRGFLEREYRRSLEGVTTPDCTRTSCTGCGICPTLHAKNVLMGDRA